MKYCMAVGTATSPTTPLVLAGDFAVSMRRAKEMGYDGVEIHIPDPEVLDIGQLTGACRELGMFLATLGTGPIYGKYGLHLMDPEPERRARILSMVREYVDIAAAIGSKVTVGSIKGRVPKELTKEQALDVMGENMREITEYALPKGVQILLEATNRYENDVLNTGRQVRDFIVGYGLKGTQALIDTYHSNIEEIAPDAGLRDAGETLGHIHFADNIRWYPGSGAFDFDRFCETIRDLGYDGVVSLEAYPMPDGETAARRTIEFFREQFG